MEGANFEKKLGVLDIAVEACTLNPNNVLKFKYLIMLTVDRKEGTRCSQT